MTLLYGNGSYHKYYVPVYRAFFAINSGTQFINSASHFNFKILQSIPCSYTYARRKKNIPSNQLAVYRVYIYLYTRIVYCSIQIGAHIFFKKKFDRHWFYCMHTFIFIAEISWLPSFGTIYMYVGIIISSNKYNIVFLFLVLFIYLFSICCIKFHFLKFHFISPSISS